MFHWRPHEHILGNDAHEINSVRTARTLGIDLRRRSVVWQFAVEAGLRRHLAR